MTPLPYRSHRVWGCLSYSFFLLLTFVLWLFNVLSLLCFLRVWWFENDFKTKVYFLPGNFSLTKYPASSVHCLSVLLLYPGPELLGELGQEATCIPWARGSSRVSPYLLWWIWASDLSPLCLSIKDILATRAQGHSSDQVGVVGISQIDISKRPCLPRAQTSRSRGAWTHAPQWLVWIWWPPELGPRWALWSPETKPVLVLSYTVFV